MQPLALQPGPLMEPLALEIPPHAVPGTLDFEGAESAGGIHSRRVRVDGAADGGVELEGEFAGGLVRDGGGRAVGVRRVQHARDDVGVAAVPAGAALGELASPTCPRWLHGAEEVVE